MIRSSTLLRAFAFALLFGLAGANVAMAANAGTDKPDKEQAASSDQHEAKTTTKAVTSDPTACTETTGNCVGN